MRGGSRCRCSVSPAAGHDRNLAVFCSHRRAALQYVRDAASRVMRCGDSVPATCPTFCAVLRPEARLARGAPRMHAPCTTSNSPSLPAQACLALPRASSPQTLPNRARAKAAVLRREPRSDPDQLRARARALGARAVGGSVEASRSQKLFSRLASLTVWLTTTSSSPSRCEAWSFRLRARARAFLVQLLARPTLLGAPAQP